MQTIQFPYTDNFWEKAIQWANNAPIVVFTCNSTADHKGFDNYLAIGSIENKLTKPQQNWAGYKCYPLQGNAVVKFDFEDEFFFLPQVSIKQININVIEIQGINPNQIHKEIIGLELKKSSEKSSIQLKPSISKQEYIHNFDKIKSHILRGDIYITNYCIELCADNVKVSVLDLWKKILSNNQAPYSCFVKHNDSYLLCASPELFLEKQGSKLYSKPIKGTAPRGIDKVADQKIINQLRNDSKEQNENVMVVDLVRNDLSTICNRVKVDELFGIYSFKNVHQMISTISGNVQNDTDLKTILDATFPMGSMTGAPKKNAIKISAQYEPFERQLYSGTVGYGNGNDITLNVVIRAFCYNAKTGYLSVKVGSAITAGANAEHEYEECLLKANALLKLLET